ncbi:MAG TPA: hypothetical protein VM328_04705 [Fimbriimonadaceae bacterium]|nr:hypothetical protein [Fimbriimonadaceae bacterium]
MADPNDVAATKLLRTTMVKHNIDLTLADLRVSHGVAYIRGSVAAQRNSGITDIRTEIEKIARILRQRPGIRDVVVDCRYRT